jgi:hypothetical protein
MMATTNIVQQRLFNQQLEDSQLTTPSEVVAWLGAVQAQEYALAKWALGQRMQAADDALIEQAFSDGAILRTHVMRPTWHFVTPEDIRWMQMLTAPRVNAASAYYYRQTGLDDALFARSNEVIAKALQGGKQLTREELGEALARAGIEAKGVRLGYIMIRAELDAILCSGARRGKQFTYALVEERAPQAKILTRDEALAELVKRYFTSHGPAQIKDFVWWSGLTVADAKAGLEMCKPTIVSEDIGGKTYWRAASMPAVKDIGLKVHLLPVYDENTIAYKDRSDFLDPVLAQQPEDLFFTSAVMLNGRAIGLWRRTFNKGSVVIETRFFHALSPAENDAFHAAAQRFGNFLGMPVVVA